MRGLDFMAIRSPPLRGPPSGVRVYAANYRYGWENGENLAGEGRERRGVGAHEASSAHLQCARRGCFDDQERSRGEARYEAER